MSARPGPSSARGHCSIILGPLSNPAGVKRQLVGVFSAAWLEPMAEVLRNFGSERVWVTHGLDGLDEITTTGPTKVVELKGGALHAFELTPEAAGLPARRRRRSRAASRPITRRQSSMFSVAPRAPIATLRS